MRLNSFYHEAVERSLDGYALRHEAIAGNIANVNTPNYVNQTVEFEESLREALFEAAVPTDGAHDGTQITEAGSHVLLTWQPSMRQAADGPQRLDGNNIPVEKQMAEMSHNAIKFNAIASAVTRDIQLIKSISQPK